jgi:hypothetical protein
LLRPAFLDPVRFHCEHLVFLRVDLVEGIAMRGVIRRAGVAAGTVMVLLGLPAGVASAGSSPAVLSFQPTGHDYGSVSVGQTSEQQFRLTNTGGRGSSALTVTVSGSTAFTVTTDTCTGTSLGPGKACAVTVRFTPAAAGPATATMTAVVRNRAVTATAELTGTGRRLGSPAPFSHLYWTMADGSFFLVEYGPLTGGANSPAGLLASANYLAVDDTYIYWSDGSDGSIRRRLLTGGPSTSLATGQNGPEGIAVDATNVYWANLQDGTINKTPLAGDGHGPITTLVDRQPGPIGLAVDATYLYWSTTAGTINRATLAGDSQTQLASGQSNPAGVTVDANNVYWTTSNGQLGSSGTISSVPLDGSGPTPATVVVNGQNLPVGVVAYEGQLYWANAGDGTIMTNGAVNPLFQGLSTPRAVAVGP